MDKKISELVAATTVSATDSLVIVQAGETRKISPAVLFNNVPVSITVKQDADVVAEGVMSLTTSATVIDSVAYSNKIFSLAAGTHGLTKEIFVKSLVPTYTAHINVAEGINFSSIEFSSYGQSVYLRNVLGKWYVISSQGATIA